MHRYDPLLGPHARDGSRKELNGLPSISGDAVVHASGSPILLKQALSAKEAQRSDGALSAVACFPCHVALANRLRRRRQPKDLEVRIAGRESDLLACDHFTAPSAGDCKVRSCMTGKDRTLSDSVTPTVLLGITAERPGQWSLDQLCIAVAERLGSDVGRASFSADVDHAVRRLVATGEAETARPGVYRFVARRASRESRAATG